MKKAIAIVAIITLAACGSNNTVAINADSTKVATDTTAKVDSTVAPTATDSVAKK